MPFIKEMEEAIATRNAIIEDHTEAANKFQPMDDFAAIHLIRTKFQDAESSLAGIIYDISTQALNRAWSLSRFVETLQTKLDFVSGGQEKRSSSQARYAQAVDDEKLALFLHAYASRTGYIDRDTVEILKRMTNDPDILTKFVEARSQYFANKSASTLPPSTTPSTTGSSTSSITKSTASNSTALPHQYSSNDRKGNMAATKEESEGSDIEDDSTTKESREESTADLHNILHMLSVKRHNGIIG